MIFTKKLKCSFCRRGAAEVEKLVAGPRVYICDRCAAEVLRIMNEAGGTPPDSDRRAEKSRKGLADRR